jgi:hypothetical protein
MGIGRCVRLKPLKTIDEKKILFVEGDDEYRFFEALLKYLGINRKEIGIYSVEGKDKFKEELPSLVNSPGFKKVGILAIIRDADDNAEGAFQSIKNIIEKMKLKTPMKINQFADGKPEIGIFIMPGNSDKGMLEDLCLKTVLNNPAMACVNPFIECVTKLSEPSKNISKAKAQAFLAAMPECVPNVGIGAQKNHWDFSSDVLNDLKEFIGKLG